MWPFHRKATPPPGPAQRSLQQSIDHLATIGIRCRQDVSVESLADSLDCTLESAVDPVQLLCVLGEESESGEGGYVSDNIWHLDAECIEDHGDYVRLAERIVSLTGGVIQLQSIKDYVDIQEGVAWLQFALRGKSVKWDLEVSDDWLAPEFYSNFQELARRENPNRGFFICALGQDSLIGYGDAQMKDAVGRFAGLQFTWE
jgi:hypothetical protein